MLWVTWRQHRWQLLGVAAAVALYVAWLVRAGLKARSALAGCPMTGRVPERCYEASDAINDLFNTTNEMLFFGNLLPLLAGMFWGAPLLSRELSQGTYRFAFTQSVSRRRWLAVKLGTLAGAAAGLGLVVGVTVSWSQRQFTSMFWNSPFGDDGSFSQSGAVPVGSWVFSLMLGTALGVLAKRGMAALGLTLVVAPLVYAGLSFARPHYVPPVERLADASTAMPDPGPKTGPRGWILSVSYVDATGRRLDSAAAGAICADPANSYPTEDCMERTGMRQRVLYQPPGRYPWFQAIEVGILLAASAALAGVVWWRLRRHVD